MLTGELGSGLQRIWKHLWTLLTFLSAPLLNRPIVRQGMPPPDLSTSSVRLRTLNRI